MNYEFENDNDTPSDMKDVTMQYQIRSQIFVRENMKYLMLSHRKTVFFN